MARKPATQTATEIHDRAIPTTATHETIPATKPPSLDPLGREHTIPRGGLSRTWRSIQRYIWDDPDKPKSERWFLFKLDLFLLSSACLGYFSKTLDQANINNAFVSGMQEALVMDGSQLTYAMNCFIAGYVIGEIPAVILVTRVRPSILIPTTELLWTICTFCSAAVTSTSQLYAIRFMVGLFESAYFPVMIYMIGSWYTKEERGKRVTLFFSSSILGQLFSGYLQAGAYKGLNGRLGHEGWQWLFIICGVISLPVAFLGYFFFPDFPETTRAFYITPEEADWARQRLTLQGLQPLGAAKWNRTKIFRIMKQWQFWVLPVGYFVLQGSFLGWQPVFALWLRSTGHSVYERNVWPTGQIAIGFILQVAAGMISDSPLLKGQRWQAMLAMTATTLGCTILLAVWYVPDGLKFAAYYLSYAAAGVPGLYFAWFPELISHDHEMRGFVIATANTFSYIMSIWYITVCWQTRDAPQFRKGFTASSVLSGLVFVLIAVIYTFQRKDDKRRALAGGDRDEEDSAIETPEATKVG